MAVVVKRESELDMDKEGDHANLYQDQLQLPQKQETKESAGSRYSSVWIFLFIIVVLIAVIIGAYFKYVDQDVLLKEREKKIAQTTQELEKLKQKHLEQGEKNKEIIKGKEDEIAQKIKELKMQQQSYAEQSKLIDESNRIASIYQKQLDLIKTIGKAIKNMDICYLQLEKYCSLKANVGNSSDDDELHQMQRLKIYLGCEEELSEDYHLKIKDSFQQYIKNVLKFRKAQIDLMTDGNFDMMAAEQSHSSSVPADTCHFICDLEETDIKSSEDATVFEMGWKVFKAFFA